MSFRVGVVILEMGELHERDVKEYLMSAKQIKIIFEKSSDLICLVDKALPVLFGEVFQVTMHRVCDIWIKYVIHFDSSDFSKVISKDNMHRTGFNSDKRYMHWSETHLISYYFLEYCPFSVVEI
jgi:hypothetical protein